MSATSMHSLIDPLLSDIKYSCYIHGSDKTFKFHTRTLVKSLQNIIRTCYYLAVIV